MNLNRLAAADVEAAQASAAGPDRPASGSDRPASGSDRPASGLWASPLRPASAAGDPRANMLSLQSFLRKGVSLAYVGSI
ncbi:hypothetical protein T484DRAFT_1791328 [Baffinella frigidus]|nr:hypothetical protein T484DRAFT_1791328 [Cryptophyta sp. CCMP2293]